MDILIHKRHALLADTNGYIIVDTGSPASFHKDGSITINGQQHACAQSILMMSYDDLSQQLELPIVGLLGMDIMGQYDVLFDYPNSRIEFDYQGSQGISLNAQIVMGIPTIPITIEGELMQCFLDSGAPTSYVNSHLTKHLSAIETREDFYPEIGTFSTPIYALSAQVADLSFDAQFGNLPFLMEASLSLANSNGIIGYDLFSRCSILIAGGNVYLQSK